MGIAVLIVSIISIREVFLRISRFFTPILNEKLEQGQLMAALNSRNKEPKNARYKVRNQFKIDKVSRKDLL